VSQPTIRSPSIHFQQAGIVEERALSPGFLVGVNLAEVDEAQRKKILDDLADKLFGNACLFCGKKFKTKALLETHFWDHNEDKVELECLVCGAGFWKKDDLHVHMNEHIKSANPNFKPDPTSPMFKLSKSGLTNHLFLVVHFIMRIS
jgi:hypothetical protein